MLGPTEPADEEDTEGEMLVNNSRGNYLLKVIKKTNPRCSPYFRVKIVDSDALFDSDGWLKCLRIKCFEQVLAHPQTLPRGTGGAPKGSRHFQIVLEKFNKI